MSKEIHLTDEALLEFVGERLSADAHRIVDQHLGACSSCLKRYQTLKFSHTVFERLADIGWNEVMGTADVHPAPRPRAFVFPWVPVLGITVSSLCMIALLLAPWGVPAVRANVLLTQAARADAGTFKTASFRIQSVDGDCVVARQTGMQANIRRPDGCDRAWQRISHTPWGSGNPLSARTYATWRSSLHRHRDSITRGNSAWAIETETEEGTVHAASLEMRASDYHTTRLTLDFADHATVTITEDTAPPLQNYSAASAATGSSKDDIDPDALEIQAWSTLHRLSADTGWEATVARDGQKICVRANVDGPEREHQIAKSFAAYPAIALEIHSSPSFASAGSISPQRPMPHGKSPGLAEAWLEQHYPSVEARMDYANNVLSLSQHILGRAYYLDKLKARQTALTHSATKRELSQIVAYEQQQIIALHTELFMSIEPLLGSPTNSSARVLDFNEARELDAALEELFSGSNGADTNELNARINEIRRLQ